MKRFLSIIVFLVICFSITATPVKEKAVLNSSVSFTDSCGRTVELPSDITKVAPSGAVATMFLSVAAPEYMTNVNSAFSKEQMEYLPACLEKLPATGQLYGSKSTINLEELIATGAQVIIDIGDNKKGIEEDLDALQQQTGIPCIFLSGSIENMAETFRNLGTILKDKKGRCEEVAAFIEKTVSMAKNNASKIKDEEKVSVMFSSLANGLGVNAKGSGQAQVIELIGAENAVVVEKVTSKGGGNLINMEQLYMFDPDVIVLNEGPMYQEISKDPAWAELSAVKNGKIYEIPGNPYCWLGNPPSLNMILGIWWLGNLIYPQYFDYEMDKVADEIYNLFWRTECRY